MKNRLFSLLPRWLFSWCISACALSLTVWRSGVQLHSAVILFLLALWIAALAYIDLVRGVSGTLGLLGLTAAVPLLLWNHEALRSYFGALRTGGTTLCATGDLLAILLLTLLAFAALYFLRLFGVRLLLSVLWIGFWITAALWERDLPRLAIGAMMPLLLFTLSETVHRLLRRKGRFDAIAPALAMILLFSAFIGVMPASPEPYPAMHALIHRVEELWRQVDTYLFYRLGGNGEYSIGFNGFSDDARTGETAGEESGQRISVEAVRDTTGPVYLAGNTWDTFRGSLWYDTIGRKADGLLDWNLDTVERLYALWRWQRSGAGAKTAEVFEENGLIIRYDQLKTQTLFTAPDTLRINADREKHPFTAYAGRVLFDHVQERDTVYAVGYLEPRERWTELIGCSEGYDYGMNSTLQWERVSRDLSRDVIPTMDGSVRIEVLLTHRDVMIRGAYLGLPADLSPEVMALANELTRSCQTDYEKLNAIAQYLRENYSYTTAPRPVPEGTPFLDYLLFDAREGYCTWYATAATLLSRAAGVPARYVQGYRAELERENETQLSGAQSHAWCEGYIRGFGWVIVEATPGYSGPDGRTAPDKTRTAGEIGPVGRPARHHALIETPLEEDELPGVVIIPPDPELPEQPENTNSNDAEGSGEGEPPLEESGQNGNKRPDGPVIMLLLAVAVLAAVTAKCAARWRARRAYEKASYSERAVIDLRQVIAYLSRRGYPRAPNDSIPQYFAKVRWEYLMVDESLAQRMARLYEEVLFGDRMLEEADWTEEKRFVELLAPSRFDLRAFLRQYV